MKTEQIMALLADLRSRINPAYATQFGTESYERRLCAEAIESLVHERDALKSSNENYITLANTAYEITDQRTSERDIYQREADKLATECKALRDGIQVYQTQLEKDTVESDLDTLVRQGAEVAELKVENKTLKELTETMRKTFEGRIADAQIVVDKALLENKTLRDLLKRYRNETPLGHQPHMIAHEVDAALGETK